MACGRMKMERVTANRAGGASGLAVGWQTAPKKPAEKGESSGFFPLRFPLYNAKIECVKACAVRAVT